MRRGVEAGADRLQAAGIDVDLHRRRERLRRQHLAVRVLDIEEDVRRDELAAVRDQRVEARHLQRRDEQVALADRELNRVSRLPELVDRVAEVLLPPLGRRHEAGRLRTDVDAGQ